MTGTLRDVQDLQATAQQVRAARTKNGWSKEEAARRAEISAITWKRVEDGLKVHDSKLAAVQRVLGLTEPAESGATEPIGEDFVEFEITGRPGVRAVVRGPVRDLETLQDAALKLAASLGGDDAAAAPAP